MSRLEARVAMNKGHQQVESKSFIYWQRKTTTQECIDFILYQSILIGSGEEIAKISRQTDTKMHITWKCLMQLVNTVKRID